MGRLRMPEEEGLEKFVQIWSRKDGEAIEFSSGSLVGRDMCGK